MPKVAPNCQFGTEAADRRGISIVSQKLTKPHRFMSENKSLLTFFTFLIISTTVLFAHVLSEHFLSESKTFWSTDLIIISVTSFSLLGVLVCLCELVSLGTWGACCSIVPRVLQVFWVIGTNCAMCFALVMMMENDQCLLSDPDYCACDYRAMHTLPEALVLGMFVTPHIFALVAKQLRSDLLYVSWIINSVVILVCVGYYNATDSLAPCLAALAASLFALMECQCQKSELTALKEKFESDTTVSGRDQQQQGDELRHLIGNVAHDLKTPLASLNMGIDVAAGTLEELAEYSKKHSASLDASSKTSINSFVQSLNETITNMKNVNVFMLMTINRCMDFTKATTGVKLVPKIETIGLAETIGLPVAIMNDMQDKRTMIRLLPIPPEVCTYIMTDKQWLQENVLCLLSNAMKYSSKGVVTISVTVTNGVKSGGYALPPISGLQRAISNLKSKPPPTGGDSATSNSIQPHKNTAAATTEPSPLPSLSRAALSLTASHSKDFGCDTPTATDSATAVARGKGARYIANSSSTVDLAAPAARAVFNLAPLSPSDTRLQYRHHAGALSPAMGRRHHPVSSPPPPLHSVPPPQCLRVEIEDTGIGLSDEAMSSLYSPFNQAQRLAGGTGLGLFSLSKRVEALKGTYGVMKRRDGAQGSLFWFEIPYRPDRERFINGGRGDLSVVIRPFSLSRHPSDRNSSSADSASQGLRLSSHSKSHSKRSASSQYEIKRSPTNYNQSSVVNDIAAIHDHILRNKESLSPSVRFSKHFSNGSEVASSMTGGSPDALAPMGELTAKRICSTPLTKAVLDKKSLNILLADDSVSIQKMTRMLLTKQGHKVTVAENGADALDLIEAGYKAQLNGAGTEKQCVGVAPYDIVLMDFQTPIMDGLEATRRLRALEGELRHQRASGKDTQGPMYALQSSKGSSATTGALVPSPLPPPVFELQLYHQFIIGLSANSDDETLQIALDTGVDQFMPKPFTVANFQEMVDTYTLYYKYEDSGHIIK